MPILSQIVRPVAARDRLRHHEPGEHQLRRVRRLGLRHCSATGTCRCRASSASSRARPSFSVVLVLLIRPRETECRHDRRMTVQAARVRARRALALSRRRLAGAGRRAERRPPSWPRTASAPCSSPGRRASATALTHAGTAGALRRLGVGRRGAWPRGDRARRRQRARRCPGAGPARPRRSGSPPSARCRPSYDKPRTLADLIAWCADDRGGGAGAAVLLLRHPVDDRRVVSDRALPRRGAGAHPDAGRRQDQQPGPGRLPPQPRRVGRALRPAVGRRRSAARRARHRRPRRRRIDLQLRAAALRRAAGRLRAGRSRRRPAAASRSRSRWSTPSPPPATWARPRR